MPSSNAVLHKKLEELETRLSNVLPHNPTDLPFHDSTTCQIRRRIDFIKTLLNAEAESNSEGKTKYLEDIGERISILETSFVGWASNSRGETTRMMNQEEIAERLSFIESNFSCFDTSETDEEDDNQEEEEEEATEKIMLSKVDIEKIVTEVLERMKEDNTRRGGWFNRIGAMVVTVAVAMVGFAVTRFGSVEELVYLVPT